MQTLSETPSREKRYDLGNYGTREVTETGSKERGPYGGGETVSIILVDFGGKFERRYFER